MMCIHMTFSKKNHSTPLHSTHSTELFKIFFSLLTLSTAFLQKASGPGKITINILIFDDKLVTMFYNKYDAVFWHGIVAKATFLVLVTMVIAQTVSTFSDKEVDIGSKYTITCTVDGGSAPNKVELAKPDRSKLIWTDTGFVLCFLFLVMIEVSTIIASHVHFVRRTRTFFKLCACFIFQFYTWYHLIR